MSGAIAASASVYLKDKRLRQWVQKEKEHTWRPRYSGSASDPLVQESDKPVVLLLDEVDALVGDTLVSLLRQLRRGYNQRPAAFPQTVILCGVRDVKDYRIQQADGEVITGGSAFNIKAESLRMGNFTQEEIQSALSTAYPGNRSGLCPGDFCRSLAGHPGPALAGQCPGLRDGLEGQDRP